MALDSKYNNYSERDKQVSNLQHLDILDANTDELEGLLSTLITTLQTTNQKLDTINTSLGGINSSIGTTNSRLSTSNSLLNDIKTNTTPLV